MCVCRLKSFRNTGPLHGPFTFWTHWHPFVSSNYNNLSFLFHLFLMCSQNNNPLFRPSVRLTHFDYHYPVLIRIDQSASASDYQSCISFSATHARGFRIAGLRPAIRIWEECWPECLRLTGDQLPPKISSSKTEKNFSRALLSIHGLWPQFSSRMNLKLFSVSCNGSLTPLYGCGSQSP